MASSAIQPGAWNRLVLVRALPPRVLMITVGPRIVGLSAFNLSQLLR
ncbi:hypothetical protein [Methylobacterium symbioticum]|uniref:Uncharacterized protein n=1 Tax=Methylobacterium symbioticum TaxID=2584084 RepID=A0A509EEA6_9HYPH|nr:hypothetical protein [Methylobacterium symbioticum]VUD71553.1 hypothetical protein MET9862_02136 [Methylobacterium symbioticum]